jgi:hypothetical protein
MSQFFTNFNVGGTWTSRWGSSFSEDVLAGDVATEIGGNFWRIDPSANERKLFSYDDVDGYADLDITIRARVDDVSVSSGAFLGIAARAGGSSGSEDSYQLWFIQGNYLRIAKYVNGSVSTLDGDTIIPNRELPADGEYFRMRFRVEGSLLLGKIWTEDLPEPPWLVAAVDTDHTSGGWAGITQYAEFDPHYIDIDAAAFGTEGYRPPLLLGPGSQERRVAHAALEIALDGAPTLGGASGDYVIVNLNT